MKDYTELWKRKTRGVRRAAGYNREKDQKERRREEKRQYNFRRNIYDY